jgi:hypothetical protein
MVVYLWETCGGGSRGVSGDVKDARRAAAEGMATSHAAGAVVEAAWLAGGVDLTYGYLRTGEEWRARAAGGRITWRRAA